MQPLQSLNLFKWDLCIFITFFAAYCNREYLVYFFEYFGFQLNQGELGRFVADNFVVSRDNLYVLIHLFADFIDFNLKVIH